MIGIKFDKAIRPLVLTMPKMSGYVKIIKVKDEDKYKNNNLMSSTYRWWETVRKI